MAGGGSNRRRKLGHLLRGTAGWDAAGLAEVVRRVRFDDEIDALLPDPGRETGRAAGRETVGPPGPSGPSTAVALSVNEIEGYLGGTLLPDCDAYSMGCSVEIRVPFVDVPFARAALGADPRRGIGKRGFAAATGDATLKRIAETRKRGFNLPMDRWMRDGPLAPVVRRAGQPDAPVTGVLRAENVAAVLDGWRTGGVAWPRAWSVACLDSWLRSLRSSLRTGRPQVVDHHVTTDAAV
ncbi:asparagine synthase-related protein [Micromonospora zhanjiangensis]